MDKEKLQELVDKKLSAVKIGKELECSKSTVVYWLKKFGISISRPGLSEMKFKHCKRCSKDKSLNEFYPRRNKPGGSVYCKVCTNQQTTERQSKFKSLCVEYKGGSCIVCGYNKYFGALDFHHVNPKEKEFRISAYKLNSISEEIKKELDKCILVCSNCHREIHGGVAEVIS